MKIDLKEYINGREDLFTANNVAEMEECLTKFLEWHEKAINYTRCCETLGTKCNNPRNNYNSKHCINCGGD